MLVGGALGAESAGSDRRVTSSWPETDATARVRIIVLLDSSEFTSQHMCYQAVARYRPLEGSTEMAAITRGRATRVHPLTVGLRTGVLALTLATAAIHASLGGMLFLANAAGYALLALAMIAPGPAGRWRWLVRVALIGFTAATIGGWVAFGPRFGLAYLDKAIEIALIGVLLIEQWHTDGGPIGVYRRARRLVGRVSAGSASPVSR